MIRLAYVIDAIHSPTAGTERQLLGLIQGLDRSRYEPFLCCLRPSHWLEREWRGCPVHVAHIGSFRHPSSWLGILRLARWLRRERIQVVQAHFRDASLAGLTAAWLARVPVLAGTRRGIPVRAGGLDALVFRAVNRIPTVFLANSRFTRDLAVREEGIDPARITVVRNILDAERFAPADAVRRRAALERLDIDGSLPVVGIVANLNPWKRHDLLLGAAAILRRRGLAVRVVCVGGGDPEPLLALAGRLGLGGRVHAAGARRDVPELLPAFDAAVLCSDFESSSNALLEYVAAGIPVVATNAGGTPEIVRDGVNGFLVPPGDATALAQALEKALTGGIRPEDQARLRDALLAERTPGAVAAAHLRAYGLEGATP